MAKSTDRSVFRRGDIWVNKRNNTGRASSIHNAQAEAVEAARAMLHNQGGGELSIMDTNGKIRSKDTIPPGNAPFPPKDTEH